ncbi:hypothetical protein AA103581_1334 [Gluconobacter wancherniae NBRC 103581]|nr:hypothetical protein AA103581_1334 [Gluconobacter wancherniae NBRC 103581]
MRLTFDLNLCNLFRIFFRNREKQGQLSKHLRKRYLILTQIPRLDACAAFSLLSECGKPTKSGPIFFNKNKFYKSENVYWSFNKPRYRSIKDINTDNINSSKRHLIRFNPLIIYPPLPKNFMAKRISDFSKHFH